MFQYSKNAFRVLGLKSSASVQEITKRVNEIKVKTSLGIAISYEYDFPFMGVIDRDEQSILNAFQRLENPVSRLKEEISWFWLETDNDEKAFNLLKKSEYKSALDIWTEVTKKGNITSESLSAFVNQAILIHSKIIEDEYIADYKNKSKKIKVKNIVFNQEHWKNWKNVINSLVSLHSNELYWKVIRNKAEKINDPRLSTEKINEIRKKYIDYIIQPNFLLISQALNTKDYLRVKNHSTLLFESWLAQETKLPSEVLRKRINNTLSSHSNRLNDQATKAEDAYRKTEKEVIDLEKLIKSIIDIRNMLISKISKVIIEGNLVDLENISEFALAKDKVSKIIRNCAVLLNNKLTSNGLLKRDSIKTTSIEAYKMIVKAVEYSATSYIRQQHEKDKEILENNLKNLLSREEFLQITSNINDQEYEEKNKLTYENKNNEWKNYVSNKCPACRKGNLEKYEKYTISCNNCGARFLQVDKKYKFIFINNTNNLFWLKYNHNSYTPSEWFSLSELFHQRKSSDKENKNEGKKETSKNDWKSIVIYVAIALFIFLIASISNDTSSPNNKTKTSNPPVVQESPSENEIEFIVYTVKAGDSLSKIAKNFNTTVKSIIWLNDLANPNVIRPGQELIIPQFEE